MQDSIDSPHKGIFHILDLIGMHNLNAPVAWYGVWLQNKCSSCSISLVCWFVTKLFNHKFRSKFVTKLPLQENLNLLTDFNNIYWGLKSSVSYWRPKPSVNEKKTLTNLLAT
jgi:hypothetical protein